MPQLNVDAAFGPGGRRADESPARIPTYTAETKPAVLQLPDRVPTGGGADAAIIGEAFQNLGDTLGKVGTKLAILQKQQQKDAGDIEGRKIASETDIQAGLLKNTIDATSLNGETPDAVQQKYRADVTKLYQDAVGQTNNPYAKKFLLDHSANVIKTGTLEVHAISLKKAGEETFNNGLNELDMAANKIASSTDPTGEDARNTYAEAQTVLTVMRKYGSPIAVGAAERSFKEKIYDKRADVLIGVGTGVFRTAWRDGQFDGMDAGALEAKFTKANRIDKEHDADVAKATVEISHNHHVTWQSMAGAGTLPQEWIQDAKDGKNRFITPEEAVHFEKWQLDPPDPGLDSAFLALRQRYHEGWATLDRVTDYQRQALSLTQGQKPNKEADKFLGELQSDMSQARSVNAQEWNKAFIRLKDDVKEGQAPPTGNKYMDKMFKGFNVQENEYALREMRRAQDTGENAATASHRIQQEILKAREKRGSGKPTDDQTHYNGTN